MVHKLTNTYIDNLHTQSHLMEKIKTPPKKTYKPRSIVIPTWWLELVSHAGNLLYLDPNSAIEVNRLDLNYPYILATVGLTARHFGLRKLSL